MHTSGGEIGMLQQKTLHPLARDFPEKSGSPGGQGQSVGGLQAAVRRWDPLPMSQGVANPSSRERQKCSNFQKRAQALAATRLLPYLPPR